MATGESKTKWNSGNSNDLSKSNLWESQFDIVLSFPGKREKGLILATEPATVEPLWAAPNSTADRNHLYFGDNLPIMAHLYNSPDIRGRVKLVYIDPPFSTNSVFKARTQKDAYHDLLVGADYLAFMYERLVFLRELMAEDGSIYVHLDDTMAFDIKIILDEIFGRQNFRNFITRRKCNPKNYTRKTYGNISDYLFFYTKSDRYTWNRSVEKWTTERAEKEYSYVEPATGRRYKKVPIHAPGTRNGQTGKSWRGMQPPPGKHWQYPPATLDEMDRRGEIAWSANGNPRRKIYLDESEGIPVQDIWWDLRDAHNQNIKITGYPTEKNPDLLRRSITASSNPDDLILDCFSGSGTTLAVGSELDRAWIGIDSSPEAISTTLRRFATGPELMGDFVSKPVSLKPIQLSLSLPFERQPVQHSNFVLLAIKDQGQELHEAIQNWQSRFLLDEENGQNGL